MPTFARTWVVSEGGLGAAMKTFVGFLKATLIGGLLVVAPLAISVLLIIQAVAGAEIVVHPISKVFPEDMVHPRVIAVLALLALCFAAGLLIRTTVGRWIRSVVERRLLEWIPGFKTLRSLGDQIAESGEGKGFSPALVEIEDALAPAFLVERHPDGRCTVFVPSAPTPMAGAIYILRGERVHLINVPLINLV